MKVLVTRPGYKGEQLAKAFVLLGIQATVFSPIDIVPHYVPQKLSAKAQYAIFVSEHAARYIPEECLKRFPSSLKIFSLGAATTRALQARAVNVFFSLKPGSTSETLLDIPLLGAANIKGHNVILICGDKGRTLLKDTLEQRGATVDKIVVYQSRVSKDTFPHDNFDFDLITASSCLGLEYLGHCLTTEQWKKALRVKILAVSPRIGRFASSIGFERVALANSATNQDIIQAAVENRR